MKKSPDTSKARVLVVGDVMLDRYWYGNASRISPEAPVPVVLWEREEERPGGAANVARNCAALGAHTHLLSVVGRDEAGADPAVEHQSHPALHRIAAEIGRESPGDAGAAAGGLESERGFPPVHVGEIELHAHEAARHRFHDLLGSRAHVILLARPAHARTLAGRGAAQAVLRLWIAQLPGRPFVEALVAVDEVEDLLRRSRDHCRAGDCCLTRQQQAAAKEDGGNDCKRNGETADHGHLLDLCFRSASRSGRIMLSHRPGDGTLLGTYGCSA